METHELMRRAATALLESLDDDSATLAHRPLDDEVARRWIEYRPRPRPGACLADVGRRARKAAHRLLATGLSPHAYAQAMAVCGLEEVLDRLEAGKRDRHSGDYWVVVFGDPRDELWAWRFEGHHLSVTMTCDGDRVRPAPVFLGANPADVTWAGRSVVRPLAPEEDLAFALVNSLSAEEHRLAVTAPEAPGDIRSGTLSKAPAEITPPGVPSARLAPAPRALLDQLLAVYLDRLAAGVVRWDGNRDAMHFAWEGPLRPGVGHYYRIQGGDLLVEYDNTSDGANHAHTVLRHPETDFGGDVLAAHRRLERARSGGRGTERNR